MKKSKQIQLVDGRGVTTPSQSVKKGGAVTTAIACSLYPLAWQTCLRKEVAMSKDIDRRPIRDQIKFHLSFAMMMHMSGRDEMAQEHMQKCQDLIDLIPESLTVGDAKEQYETLVAIQ
tara:strand:+ start:418 stop:771 length:354 start_codon:yes stop_codon:yes gene_type:complete